MAADVVNEVDIVKVCKFSFQFFRTPGHQLKVMMGKNAEDLRRYEQ